MRLAESFGIVLLAAFVCFFHVLLTFIAEISRFGDCEFYQEWWRSHNASEYWTKWNRPVHKWVKRHIYSPLQKKGYSKPAGVMAVFLFSEYFMNTSFVFPQGYLDSTE